MTIEIVGHAIVSGDGRIADAAHRMPASLRSDADWQRFQAALDASVLVVLGRLGHEAHPNPGRRRLVVSSRGVGLVADPRDPRVTIWNPGKMAFDEVLTALGIAAGTVAITGGQRVFDLFLLSFTRFDLVEKPAVTIPDGIACFSSGSPREALTGSGLHPGAAEALEPGVSLTVWRR